MAQPRSIHMLVVALLFTGLRKYRRLMINIVWGLTFLCACLSFGTIPTVPQHCSEYAVVSICENYQIFSAFGGQQDIGSQLTNTVLNLGAREYSW